LAEPGGICVSARLQEDAAGRLELKNITRPVRVYRVREAAAKIHQHQFNRLCRSPTSR